MGEVEISLQYDPSHVLRADVQTRSLTFGCDPPLVLGVDIQTRSLTKLGIMAWLRVDDILPDGPSSYDAKVLSNDTDL
jgi:hypothetical protein